MNINPDTAKNTLCKNVLIYGYCKFENKGCAFNHNSKDTSAQGTGTQGNNSGSNSYGDTNGSGSSSSLSNMGGAGSEKRKFNLNTPSFQPSTFSNSGNKFTALSPNLDEIPVFVPSGTGSVDSKKNGTETGGIDDVASTVKKFNLSTPSFTPSKTYLPKDMIPESSSLPNAHAGTTDTKPGAISNPYAHSPLIGQQNMSQMGAATSDMYFSQNSASYPLQYHLYAPAPPPRLKIPLPPHETNAVDMFIPNDLRESLQRKNEATLFTLQNSILPEHVNFYHSLVPLDNNLDEKSQVYGVNCSVFKAFSNYDGNPYALRKLQCDSLIKITNELPFRTIKRWKSVKSANVVQIHEAFTSMAFGGSYSVLIVVYDYFPQSNTLEEHHIKRRLGSKLEPITENTLWYYVIELCNALIAIHSKDLAARSSLDLSKIIVTNVNRIRLSGVGVSDILEYENDERETQRQGVLTFRKQLQQEDIRKLSKIILDLAALCLPLSLREGTSLQIISHLRTSLTVPFSAEFIAMLQELSTTNDLKEFMKNHLLMKVFEFADGIQNSHDFIEGQLCTELENARLFRLISKLNFIIDRPEHSNDPSWNENGNLYIIKLFRDYVFFQYDEYRKPVCNLSRVLVNLNKLDAGIEEKFLLVTEDEKHCIIASYKEIRDKIDAVFKSLTRG